MTRLIDHHGGWRRSPPQLRPQLADHSGLTILDEVDPRVDLPPIFDQGQLGSCTANATAAAFQYDTMLDGHDCGLLSRLWIYYYERSLEAELGQGDTGAIGSDAFKVAATVGVPKESDWPYDIATFEGPPPQEAVRESRLYRLARPYHSVVPTVEACKAVLSNRQTIAFGFPVFESFEAPDVAKTGVVPIPDPNAERRLGGHEVLLVGYLKSEPEYGLVRNSWSASWGLSGYCLFPWALLLDSQIGSGDWTTIVRPA